MAAPLPTAGRTWLPHKSKTQFTGFTIICPIVLTPETPSEVSNAEFCLKRRLAVYRRGCAAGDGFEFERFPLKKALAQPACDEQFEIRPYDEYLHGR